MRLTRPAEGIWGIFVVMLAFPLGNCTHSGRNLVVDVGGLSAERAIHAWSAWALEPSNLAHPQVPSDEFRLEQDGQWVAIRYIRAETADWNDWPDGRPRLFNNRTGHLFEVRSSLPASARLSTGRTSLELNSPEIRLLMADGPDRFLDPLINHALLQERHGSTGDLASRLRGAGGFRSAWWHHEAEGWEGLIGFPTPNGATHDGALPLSELHVVAMRLTLVLEVDGDPQTWVFVLD